VMVLLLANQIAPDTHKMMVIAHRGDHTQVPENTLASIEQAILHEADYVEIDLRTTRDSQLVIMHDVSVDRMTTGKGMISNLTLQDLRQLSILDKHHPEWGKFPIPTFDEVLKLCKGRIRIYLDFKDADASITYKKIQEAGMEKSMVVYINKARQIPDWRKVDSKMPLMVSLPRSVKNGKDMEHLLDSMQIDILDGDYYEYTEELVKAAGAKKVPVWADIQSPTEGPEEWNRALLLNLAGLQTDHPAALVAFLKDKGER